MGEEVPGEGVGVEDEDERGGGGRHFVVRRMKSPGTIKMFF